MSTIEVLEEKTFSVRAGAFAVSGLFRDGAAWHGFERFANVNGQFLIVDNNTIVKGSPELLHALNIGAVAPGFVLVPETTLPSGQVVPAFQLAQYAASKGDDGKAVIDASRKPWVSINYHDATAASELAGYALITETQWLAIAYNASQQAENWTGGEVGKGDMFQGVRTGNGAQAGNAQPTKGDERRWLVLTNGSRVCDFNGNVFQWVFDDVQGDTKGIVDGRIELDSPSLATAPYPSLKKGMGYRPDYAAEWSGRALVRGGCWNSGDYAGAFRLDLFAPSSSSGIVGFRCTKPSAGL